MEARIYKLEKGDIFSIPISYHPPRELLLYHIKTDYTYSRVWYKPWTWFKKIYFNQYEVLQNKEDLMNGETKTDS